MYRIVLSIMILFSKEEYRWWWSNLEFTGLRIPSTATISTYRMFAIFCSQSNFCINRSATSIVLSFKGNTNTKYYHIISIGSSIDCNPKPNIILSHLAMFRCQLWTLLFFSFAVLSSFFGLYHYWIQFHIKIWFLLTNWDNLCGVFLNDRPEISNRSA